MRTLVREIIKEDGSFIRVERDYEPRRHKICIREFHAVEGVLRPGKGYELGAKYVPALIAALLVAAKGGSQ